MMTFKQRISTSSDDEPSPLVSSPGFIQWVRNLGRGRGGVKARYAISLVVHIFMDLILIVKVFNVRFSCYYKNASV